MISKLFKKKPKDGFSDSMKNPANQIDKKSLYPDRMEGCVFNGADVSQMVFWTCRVAS